MYQWWLNGQSASTPIGLRRSTPSQSSRMCEAWAALTVSAIPHRVRPVTHLVTPAETMKISSVNPTLWVILRCTG